MYRITTALKKITRLTKRIKIIQGGTSAAKTISIIQLFIDKAQRDKTPKLASIVSESIPHLKKGCIRDFKRIMKEHNYWKESRWAETDKIYTFETGSQIEFFGADQAEKLRGGRRDRGFMNECNNITFEAFEEFEVRTLEEVYLDYNPTNEFWVQTEIIGKRTDYEFLILTYKDNEGLSREIIASIEQRKNRKGWWQVYGLGQLGEVEGRIYTDWSIIDEVPHEARLERYGLDFGYTNDPTSIVALYYYNGGYILDEECYQTGMSNRDIANFLKNLKASLVVADCAEPKSIDEIKGYGINIIPTVKGKDSKRYGIQVVQDQRVSITKRSINGIKEYRNYLWYIDKDGRTNKDKTDGKDDFLDASRYAMTSLIPVITRKEFIDNLPIFIDNRPKPNPAR